MFGWFGKKNDVIPKKRSFEAAKIKRTLASWLSIRTQINEELRCDLDALRARSRDLSKNDTMGKRYVSLTSANVVGHAGFKFQSRVKDEATGKPDKFANRAIEDAFTEWSKAGNYDVTGKLTRTDGEHLMVKCASKDGEILIREHIGADNRFGYMVEFLDVDRLATQLNRKREGDRNAIIMGVEVNEFNKPVQYHLYRDLSGNNRSTFAIPASQIIHAFIVETPEQARGYPWMHASMVNMAHLKKYREFAIVAAVVGASKMGFFTTPDGDGSPMADSESETTGELFQEASAGQFGVLPEGVGFQNFNPDYPHSMFADFIKTSKQDISSGFNVSYHALSNDLEGVNFSSIRSGVLEDREQWMVLQKWLIGCVLERIFGNWLAQSLLKRAIVQESGQALPATKREKFSKHEFIGRRWPWVDPLKDIQASVLAKDNFLASPQKIMAQQGQDAEEVLDDIKGFQQMVEDAGIVPVNVPANMDTTE